MPYQQGKGDRHPATKAEVPAFVLLKAAGMARSTFYYGVAAYGKDDKYATVIKLISEIYHLHKGRYGYRRISLNSSARDTN